MGNTSSFFFSSMSLAVVSSWLICGIEHSTSSEAKFDKGGNGGAQHMTEVHEPLLTKLALVLMPVDDLSQIVAMSFFKDAPANSSMVCCLLNQIRCT